MALRDRLTTIRDLAENVLERVEARWDQTLDVLHGRPIRDPYLDDPRQQPHPPGIFEPGDYVKIGGLEFDRVPMAGEVGPVRVHDVEYGHVAMLPASTRTLDDAMAWMESPAGRTAILEVATRWNEYYQQSPAASAEHAADFAERQNRHRENIRDRAERAGTAVEHAMWPDIEEDEPDLDPVRTISEGEWLIPEPGVETRLHLGQSDGGYHYAVETSYRGGDEGGPYWSQAYATREQADDAGSRRLHEIHYPDLAAAVAEVRARDWWEDQRAQILESPLSVGRREQELEALGPEPSDDARVWLNGHGERVEQPSVELQPVEVERPMTEERADRDEHALGLEREEEHSQEHAELEL